MGSSQIVLAPSAFSLATRGVFFNLLFFLMSYILFFFFAMLSGHVGTLFLTRD